MNPVTLFCAWPKWLILITSVLLSTCCSAEYNNQHSNVIFILIDDMGFGDLSITGNKVAKTPNIDKLANQGALFSQFYVNSPICSPSRVALTTGQYPQNLRISSFIHTRKANRLRAMANFLDPDTFTLADGFKSKGYATAHFGKWHMGGGRDIGEAPQPTEYGFDESYVSFEGLGDRVLQADQETKLFKMSEALGQGRIDWRNKHQNSQLYVEKSIAFIENQQDKPFYLELWFNDVHDPHQPSELNYKAYQGRGKDVFEDRFIAVLENLDKQLARLFNKLDDLGIANNTLIMLTSDNGPVASKKFYKDGHTAPGSTAGMRGRKWSLYEGGIKMPLIIKWPGHVPAGVVDTHSVLAGVDLLPTLAHLFSFTAPYTDGLDMSDTWLGNPMPNRVKSIMWEYASLGDTALHIKPFLSQDQSPQLAIRSGKWKLLMNKDGSQLELYDLNIDPFEQYNMAASQQQKSQQLSEQLLQWRLSLPEYIDPQ